MVTNVIAFIIYVYQQMHVYINLLNYITNTPTKCLKYIRIKSKYFDVKNI